MMYDNVIMRTIIDLPDVQAKALADWCKVEKISKAEAVRRALASMLAGQQQAGREKAFGAWRGKNLDVRNFVENLREEWER
jgi:hypothetical protein